MLEPFNSSIAQIYANGFRVYDATRGEYFSVFVGLRICTADAPARGEILGTKQAFHKSVRSPCPWCHYFAGEAFQVDFPERNEVRMRQIGAVLEQIGKGPVATILSSEEVLRRYFSIETLKSARA